MVHSFFGESETVLLLEIYSKRLGITVFQPRLKVRTFARTNYYEYGKQRQVQESALTIQAGSYQESQAEPIGLLPVKWRQRLRHASLH
jgi:hypothetical protein